MTWSATRTGTAATTYTEVRARYVTQKASADLEEFVARGVISRPYRDEFIDDLRQMLAWEAVEEFELKILKPNGTSCALRFSVDQQGINLPDDDSGGINVWALPDGCRAFFIVSLVSGATANPGFAKLLKELGWTVPARTTEGAISSDRVYSKEGYGLRRGIVGSFG